MAHDNGAALMAFRTTRITAAMRLFAFFVGVASIGLPLAAQSRSDPAVIAQDALAKCERAFLACARSCVGAACEVCEEIRTKCTAEVYAAVRPAAPRAINGWSIPGFPWSCSVCAPFSLPPVGAGAAYDCQLASAIERQGKSPEEKARLRQLSQDAIGALTRLRQYREAFLLKGELINLFPATYFHVTEIELTRIANGEYEYPIEKLEQILSFFAAYEINREKWKSDPDQVEPHWKRHFEMTSQPTDNRANDFYNVLTTAIDAHVNYDLARALRDSYLHGRDPNVTEEKLQADFAKTNWTLTAAFQRSFFDIWDELLPVDGKYGWLHSFDGIVKPVAGSYTYIVINGRNDAWDSAFGDQKLRTESPQPPNDVDALRQLSEDTSVE